MYRANNNQRVLTHREAATRLVESPTLSKVGKEFETLWQGNGPRWAPRMDAVACPSLARQPHDAGCTPASFVDVGQERTEAWRSPLPLANRTRFVSTGPADLQAKPSVQAVKNRSSAALEITLRARRTCRRERHPPWTTNHQGLGATPMSPVPLGAESQHYTEPDCIPTPPTAMFGVLERPAPASSSWSGSAGSGTEPPCVRLPGRGPAACSEAPDGLCR